MTIYTSGYTKCTYLLTKLIGSCSLLLVMSPSWRCFQMQNPKVSNFNFNYYIKDVVRAAGYVQKEFKVRTSQDCLGVDFFKITTFPGDVCYPDGSNLLFRFCLFGGKFALHQCNTMANKSRRTAWVFGGHIIGTSEVWIPYPLLALLLPLNQAIPRFAFNTPRVSDSNQILQYLRELKAFNAFYEHHPSKIKPLNLGGNN